MCDFRRRLGPVVGLIVLLSVLVSCGKDGRKKEIVSSFKEELSIGLIPEQNIFDQLDRYEPLVEYVSRRTGVRLKLRILSRYGNIIDNFNSLHLDGAFFGSFSYVLAHRKLRVEVLVRPENADGSFSYHGLIFVRKDSGIKGVNDMKGKIFAFVDRATFAGYVFPLKYFADRGVSDFESYFKEIYYTGTHEDGIYDVLEGRADVGAAKNSVFERVASRDPRILKELRVLARSPDVPETAFALREGLDHSLRERLKRAFLDMNRNAQGREILRKFGAQRFVETSDRDYESVYSYCEDIGLDLSSYNYRNE